MKHARQPIILVLTSNNYIANLRQRMQQYRVRQADLARESGLAPSQVARWFNRSSARTGKAMAPSFESIYDLERAMQRILRKRQHE